MTRRGRFLLAFPMACALASPLLAAPVPKEVRAAPAHVGTWQCVAPDPKDPAKRTPYGQRWIIGAEGGVSFRNPTDFGPIAEPTERFAFDPSTGHVDHTVIGGKQRTLLGLYKIEGDLLTVHLNTGGTTRPSGLTAGPGTTAWHLARAPESK